MISMASQNSFYGIIVSDEPNEEHPLWTFVKLFKTEESAILGIDTQYHLEHQHAKSISRSASGTRIFAEGARGHLIEFRLVALKAPIGFNPATTSKLYAVSVNGHIPVTGESFYTSIEALKKEDVYWQRAMDMQLRSRGRVLPDGLGIDEFTYSTFDNQALRRFRIEEFIF